MGTEDVNKVYWVPLVGLNIVFIATIVASIWLVHSLWHKGIFAKTESIIRMELVALGMSNFCLATGSLGLTYLDYAPSWFQHLDMDNCCDWIFMGYRRSRFFSISCELLIAISLGLLALGSSRCTRCLRFGLFCIVGGSLALGLVEASFGYLGGELFFASYDYDRNICDLGGKDYLAGYLIWCTVLASYASVTVIAVRAYFFSESSDARVWCLTAIFPVTFIVTYSPELGVFTFVPGLWTRTYSGVFTFCESFGGLLSVLTYACTLMPIGLPQKPFDTFIASPGPSMISEDFVDIFVDRRSVCTTLSDLKRPETGARALAAAGLRSDLQDVTQHNLSLSRMMQTASRSSSAGPGSLRSSDS